MCVLDISRNLLVTPTKNMDPTAGGGLQENAFEKVKLGGGKTKGVIPPLDGGG